MTDTTTDKDWLDEILTQAYADGASDTMWQNGRDVEIYQTAKAAILKEIDRIIGTTPTIPSKTITPGQRNRLVHDRAIRDAQRQRAGLSKKEDKET